MSTRIWTRIQRRAHLNRTAVAGAVSLVLVLGAGLASANDTVAYVPGRLLVLPKAGLPEAAFSKILGENGGGKTSRIGKSGLRLVDVPPGLEAQMVDRLSRNPNIKFAERDQFVKPDFTPNDPYFGSEWHLPKTGVVGAWDIAKGDGVTIAILDSGVDGTHPDLASRMVPGWNFFDNNSNTVDVTGHGTKVAGTAAGLMSNSIGVAGVAGQAQVMPIRITDTAGNGTFAAAASALTYAADHGARVANMSYAGMMRSTGVASAAQYYRSKGGVLTISAGNTGTEVADIPALDTVIVLSATDQNDVKASWSSSGSYVDLSAPGASIYTTVAGGGYAAVSGTSFSAPLTAGVVALMMSAKPGLTPVQIEDLLFTTAFDLGASGKDKLYGYGRVDALAAVNGAITASAPAADTQPPAVVIINPLGAATLSGLAPVDVSASDNVGVARVELRANGVLVGTDIASPYAFSWDTRTVVNGMATLEASAYDAAGNLAKSAQVQINVANALDTTPPTLLISNPQAGTKVKGLVEITVLASDDSGAATLSQKLYIDNVLVSQATGATLSYKWNTKKAATGARTIRAEAQDAAGNMAATTIQVVK